MKSQTMLTGIPLPHPAYILMLSEHTHTHTQKYTHTKHLLHIYMHLNLLVVDTFTGNQPPPESHSVAVKTHSYALHKSQKFPSYSCQFRVFPSRQCR